MGSSQAVAGILIEINYPTLKRMVGRADNNLMLSSKDFPPEWPKIVPALLVLLLAGTGAWVCVNGLHGLGVLMSDGSEFEYDHNLPRGYEGRTEGRLKSLQVAVVEYAQSHKGYLPPMQNSDAALKALTPYLGRRAKWHYRNPATAIPFSPNSALTNQKLGRISNHGRAILFYDANPPAGFRESYYVTLNGQVSHVPVVEMMKLL